MAKKMKILIAGSLFLNVLLAGLLLGFVLGDMSHRFFRKPPPGWRPLEVGVKLPPAKEKLFFETMEKTFQENREIHRRIGQARERVLDILSAPQFDETAYQVEVAKIEELRGLTMRRLAEATKGLAGQFTQEERKALAEHLRRPPPPPGHESGPPPKAGPPPRHP